tara:strand:+ start:1693 stop:1923 length:231 start_codon:yes stop_codon:yes gene_type:complete
MPKYEGLEDDDLILIDPDTGKTLRVPAQKLRNLDLDVEPADFSMRHAANTIEEDKLGKDIIGRIKKKIDEWSKKQK